MSRHGGQPLPEPMIAVAAVTPPPVGPRGERRAARRRQRRRNRLLAGVVVLLLAALAAGLTLAAHSGGHKRPAVVASRPQQTLLLGIGPMGGDAATTALYGVDPGTKSGADLLLPPDTLVDGPGGTVGGSYSTTPSSEFEGAVSDLLGVHVDGVWRLTPTGLSELIDRLGGVQVTVDIPIQTAGLTLSPGAQHLAGAQAAGFALYGGDTEQAKLNRTRLVLDAVLAELPAQSALTTMLASLGPESASSLPAAGLATFLESLAASDLQDNEQLLPVTTLDTGGSSTSFAFDPKQAPPVVAQLFAGSLLSSDGSVGTRVEIINDSGRPDLTTSARAGLSAAGLTFVRAINDTPFHQYKQSSILVFSSAQSSIAFGHRVAAALGIPNAPVLVSDQDPSVADALAVLADDYPG